jgi:2-polyprenyl-3-methyl-5-hydroxy-6-metoxy-1,4-benzoquinol methylase
MLTQEHLLDTFRRKYEAGEPAGWSPRLRRRFGYFNPDDIYEATADSLVGPATAWLDVGCGRDIFPSNLKMAGLLADRCQILVGLDPSDNIEENRLLHERYKGTIESFQTGRRFDLVTLRMVAEHISNPAAAAEALSRLCKPGGQVVIYTVYRWSPVTIISAAAPFRFHHLAKKLLWNTEEKDTFPTEYRMNTRRDLRRIMGAAGFEEQQFSYLDDCRSFARWKLTSVIELCVWKVLRAAGLHYPEVCLLGVYRKRESARNLLRDLRTMRPSESR